MPPQPTFRVLRAGWIMARAFTPHLVFAPLAFPWTVMSVIPGAIRRGLYLDATRTGMVMLYRSRFLLDVLLAVPIVLVAMACYFGVLLPLIGTVLPGDIGGPVFLGTTVLLIVGMLFLLPRGGGAMFPFGPETPKGDRWEAAGLAQLPGTRFTAIQLALQVIDTVPPAGSVIIATANSSKLLRQYVTFGFTEGKSRRVYKIVS